MLPTFRNNEEVIVVKAFNKIDRFDIVAFNYGEKEKFVKRIIGLPGDTISDKDGLLYVNKKIVEDPYHIGNENFTLSEVTGLTKVPENCYFVLGDNRRFSRDSRDIGFVKGEDLIGIVKEKKGTNE